MNATHRAVQLESFRIVESHLELVDHGLEETDPTDQVLVDLYDYDISMECQVVEVDKETVALTISVVVNGGEDPKHGYHIFAQGMMIYLIEELGNNRSSNHAYEAKMKEAIQLGVGAIRGYLMNLTSLALFGTYTLPNIEVETYHDLDLYDEFNDYDDDDDDQDDDDQDDADLEDGVRSLHPKRR